MLDIAALEQRIAAEMKENQVPGFAIAVVKGTEVLYANGFGVTSVEDGGLPVTPRTLFRIGSTTKPLTGTMIMRLVEAGTLDLDRPIMDYIPWLRLGQEGAAEAVTLRLLLSHQAGLPDGGDLLGAREPHGLERWVRETLPTLPLVAWPGKVYSYSNHSTNLAGYVAEAATGRRYADLMRELLFEPLGMERSTFDPLVAMTYPLAQNHEKGEDGQLRTSHQFAENTANHPSWFGFSTVLDMARFAMLHLNRGAVDGKQLLSPASLAEMHRPQADWWLPSGEGAGLTLCLEPYRGTTRIWHTGAIGSYRSALILMPAEGYAVVTLANQFYGWEVAADLVDELLGLAAVSEAVAVAEADRSRWPLYEGAYLSPVRGLAEVRADGERLTLTLNGQAAALNCFGPDRYFVPDGEGGAARSLGFVPEPDGGPVQCLVINGKVAQRVERTPGWQPDPTAWAALEGTYADAVFTFGFRVEDGQPCFVDEGEPIPCYPIADTAFFAPGLGLIEFLPGEIMQIMRGWRCKRV